MSNRILLVEDDPINVKFIQTVLVKKGGYEVVVSEEVEEILRLAHETPLLAIIMDVSLLAAVSQEPLPYVIFVTAFDHYAVQAFERGALDYLLKPVAPDRFDLAIERARHQLSGGRAQDLADRLDRALEQVGSRPRLERFLVKEGERSRLVPLQEIEWIEAAGNYLKLHGKDAIHLVRGTLKLVETRLDPARFARIHRTVIVNLDRIRYLEPWSHGDQLVVLESGARLTLSRRFRDRMPGTLGEQP